MIGRLTLILKLRELISIKWRHIFYIVLISVLSSFLELISIASIIPFITVLLTPELALDHLRNFGFKFFLDFSQSEIRLFGTIIFVLAILAGNLVRMNWMIIQSKIGARIGNKIASQVYQNYIDQDYQKHKMQNSGYIIGLFTTKVNEVIAFIVLPVMTTASSLILLFLGFIALAIVDPLIISVTIGVVGLTYYVIGFLSKRSAIKYGYEVSVNTSLENKTIIESLGGIRDLILHQNRNIYSTQFNTYDLKLKNAHANLQLLGTLPKYFIEMVAISAIAIIAYNRVENGKNFTELLPILALFVLAAQRIMPLIQLIYSNMTSMRAGFSILEEVMPWLKKLDNSIIEIEKNITFDEAIILHDVNFRYSKGSKILKNVNLKINKGEWIGITGKSGSGKSTLIDIIMGLLKPTSGYITVDGTILDPYNTKSYQSMIAHVSQNTFVFDDTIEKNIRLFDNSITRDTLIAESINAQLYQNYDDANNNIKLSVGERGGNLSGGQRQRLGLARAFVQSGDLIILDEATNALDKYTELLVLKTLREKYSDTTVIIISHDNKNLNHCDRIINVESGQVK